MLQPKTHFEQIPLDTVKRIVEEQIRQEKAAEDALREGLQVMSCGANEQSERPVAFDAALLPWMLRPIQLKNSKYT